MRKQTAIISPLLAQKEESHLSYWVSHLLAKYQMKQTQDGRVQLEVFKILVVKCTLLSAFPCFPISPHASIIVLFFLWWSLF